MNHQRVQHSPSLERARKRRAELRDSMLVLERALAAPAPGRAEEWAELARAGLRQLQADFHEHVSVTEGPDGLYEEIVTTAPRLANAVRRLLHEHIAIGAALDALVEDAAAPPDQGWVARIRDQGTGLLTELLRHRQRGADLVFEAYSTDIGGE